MNKNCNKALGFLKLGTDYLYLVKNVSNEMVNKGDNLFLILDASDGPPTAEDYEKQTKWSDYNNAIPLLFNFYHGLELLLKGFLYSKCILSKSNHKLSNLLEEFQDNFPESTLISLFDKYINEERLPKMLKEFCKKSSITIDDYYQALKYPESTRGNLFNHYSLKYNRAEGIDFFKDLRDDIDKIGKESVSLETCL